jgi:hypothetical protein
MVRVAPALLVLASSGSLWALGACSRDPAPVPPAAAAPAAEPAATTRAPAPASVPAMRVAVAGASAAMRGVRDATSAERARAELVRCADELQRQVGNGGDLPRWLRELDGEAGDLRGALQAQVGKLAAQPEVAKVLGPVLARLHQIAFGAGAPASPGAPFLYTIF